MFLSARDETVLACFEATRDITDRGVTKHIVLFGILASSLYMYSVKQDSQGDQPQADRTYPSKITILSSSHSIPALSWHSEQSGGQRVVPCSGRIDPQQLAGELLPHQDGHSYRPHGGHSDHPSGERKQLYESQNLSSSVEIKLTLQLLCQPG